MTLNTDFLSILEHAISRALHDLGAGETKGFWCDGVLLTEDDYHYSIKSVNDNRYIILKALVGKNGQTPYGVKLLFGNRAMSRYGRGLSLDDCIPSRADEEWFEIDTVSKRIVVHLD